MTLATGFHRIDAFLLRNRREKEERGSFGNVCHLIDRARMTGNSSTTRLGKGWRRLADWPADSGDVSAMVKITGPNCLFLSIKRSKSNQAVWPVIYAITGPTCALAFNLLTLNELSAQGHHDRPVMAMLRQCGGMLPS